MNYDKLLRTFEKRSHENSNQYTDNMYQISDYDAFMRPAYKLLKKNPSMEKHHFYEELQNKSGLQKNLKHIVDNLGIVPGMIAAYGDCYDVKYCTYGKRGEDDRDINEECIFDLASVTKLFTSVAYLMIVERGYCRLSDAVGKFTSRFAFIKSVTIEDLLSFRINLQTIERIAKETSCDAGLKLIETVKPHPPNSNGRYYSDIPALVLGYLFEDICGISLGDFIVLNILQPCSMNQSFYYRPKKELLADIMNYDAEYRIHNDRFEVYHTPVSRPHDQKASLLMNNEKTLTGHAGLFASAKDMASFAQKLLLRELISDEYLQLIGINRTGKLLEEEKYSQFLGLLCYSKHHDKSLSEVFHGASGNAFAISGYTGTYLCIDPNNDIFVFIGTNRIANRVTQCPEGLMENNRVNYQGKEYICSKEYVFLKDEWVRDCCMKLALQWKLFM